ncbi:MAG: DUF975 family protein [Lachnospiraceae bacterium]
MKRSCKELKGLSRQTLIGNYGLAILSYFLVQLIIGLAMTPFENQLNTYSERTLLYEEVISFPIFSLLAIFIIAMVSTALAAGVYAVHLNLARGTKPSVSMIFSQLKCRPDRYIVVTFLLSLIGTVCVVPGTILCCMGIGLMTESTSTTTIGILVAGIALFIGGIVLCIFLSLRFSLTILLLVDHSDMGAITSMKESFHLMKGNCGRFLYISFSFIPMMLLVLLSFGIAALWIQPYIEQVTCWFYLDVSGEIDRKQEEERRMEEEMGPVLSDEMYL